MYKNRIRPTSTNLDVQSFIRRCEIAYDERARYVEFVCNVWNEGRFGPDLADPVLVNWHDCPEPEPTLLSDLLDGEPNWPNGPAGYYAVAPLGRAGFQAAEAAFQRANQMGLSDAVPKALNSRSALTSNQGRGSPQTMQHQMCTASPEHQRCVVIQPAAPPQERETNDPSRNAAA